MWTLRCENVSFLSVDEYPDCYVCYCTKSNLKEKIVKITDMIIDKLNNTNLVLRTWCVTGDTPIRSIMSHLSSKTTYPFKK